MHTDAPSNLLRGNDFYVIIIMQFFMNKFMFAVRGAAKTELYSDRLTMLQDIHTECNKTGRLYLQDDDDDDDDVGNKTNSR